MYMGDERETSAQMLYRRTPREILCMKRPLLHPFVLLLCLLLQGCGTYYTVSVDSLRDDKLAADVASYYMEPGNEGTSEDDLLFKDVVQTLTPAFAARGYTVLSERSEAEGIARVFYQEDEPSTRLKTSTVTRKYPVMVRDRFGRRVEYVRVDEPRVTPYLVYGAQLRVEAYARNGKGVGKQLWRTSVVCTSEVPDFRAMLSSMVPVLQTTLSVRTEGKKHFEVFIDDKGKVTTSEISAFSSTND